MIKDDKIKLIFEPKDEFIQTTVSIRKTYLAKIQEIKNSTNLTSRDQIIDELLGFALQHIEFK